MRLESIQRPSSGSSSRTAQKAPEAPRARRPRAARNPASAARAPNRGTRPGDGLAQDDLGPSRAPACARSAAGRRTRRGRGRGTGPAPRRRWPSRSGRSHQQQLGQAQRRTRTPGCRRRAVERVLAPRRGAEGSQPRAVGRRGALALRARQADRAVHRQRAAGGEPSRSSRGSPCERSGDKRRQRAAKRLGQAQHRPHQRPERDRLRVPGIAPEQLVGTLAGKHHLDAVPPRQPADEVQRNADRIAERLVLVVDETRQEAQRILLRELTSWWSVPKCAATRRASARSSGGDGPRSRPRSSAGPRALAQNAPPARSSRGRR